MVAAEAVKAAAQRSPAAAHLYPKREIAFFIDLSSFWSDFFGSESLHPARGPQRLTQEKAKSARGSLPGLRDSHKALQCKQFLQSRRRLQEIILDFVQQPFFVRLVIDRKGFGKLLEKLSLLAGQLRRNPDGDVNHQVPAPAALHLRN